MIAYNKSEAHRKVAAELGRKMFLAFRQDPVIIEKLRTASRAHMARYNATPAAQQQRLTNLHNRWHAKRGIVNPHCKLCSFPVSLGSTVVNHKVVAIEPAGRADVYDITVDNYHDFALSAGVFVHNCVDPNANLSEPEVCDECAGNCNVDYRNFFDSNSKWISQSSSAFPPSFPYAFFIEGIVLPSSAKDCPAPIQSCQYPPP